MCEHTGEGMGMFSWENRIREKGDKQNMNFLGGFCAAGEKGRAEGAVSVPAVPSGISPARSPCPDSSPVIPCLCPCTGVIEVHVQFFLKLFPLSAAV